MKKFFVIAMAICFITTSVNATDAYKVSTRVLNNFNANFENATNVSWVVKPDYSKATYMLDNRTCDAFFDNQGELIANSHGISIGDLPTAAKRSFAKKYANYTVKEVIQFDTNEETCYYISAENEKHAVVLKVSQGFLSVCERRLKKGL